MVDRLYNYAASPPEVTCGIRWDDGVNLEKVETGSGRGQHQGTAPTVLLEELSKPRFVGAQDI